MPYIVQPGDSLYFIAQRFNTTPEAIIAANQLVDPTLIYPGQLLNIPTGSSQPAEGFYYTIQPGESLYQIANRYDVALRDLIRANGIEEPYIIYPGQRILIPGAAAPEPPAGGKIYIVQEGDTLYSIADKFNAPIDEIIRLNNIPRPDLIYPGQRLIIPAPEE